MYSGICDGRNEDEVCECKHFSATWKVCSGLGLIAFCGLLAQLSAIRWLKLQEARMTLVGKLLFHGRQVMLLRL